MTNFQNFSTLNDTIDFLASEIPPVVCRDGRQYPFIGEKAVRARLEDNEGLRVANAFLMYHLQTQAEQACKETQDKNKRGLMSSHAKTGTKIIEALLVGAVPDETIEYKVDGRRCVGWTEYLAHVGGRYAKQLSVALRNWAISQEPQLGVTAGMFVR